jgi:hypothetical protein
MKKYLDHIWDGSRLVYGITPARLRAGLAAWRPAAVVAVVSSRSPLGRVLIDVLGRPASGAARCSPGGGGRRPAS